MSRSAIAQARAWISKHAARPNDGHAPHLAPLALAGTEREALDDLCEFRAVCAAAGVRPEVADVRDYVQIVETPEPRLYRVSETITDAAGDVKTLHICDVTAHGHVAAAIEAAHRSQWLAAMLLAGADVQISVEDLGRCEQ